ncbi:uncharacterized protein A4U43_C04F1100 [Asparagus officinalis]|uniref:Uncharacterized protein n=1 Tax=Asparagus officinalis TaxID=4686 RepID=A0A5P1EXF5_ASPOF|nr:uncharacterized protein A4U43_C04F1100 [Asparagus officinalis]
MLGRKDKSRYLHSDHDDEIFDLGIDDDREAYNCENPAPWVEFLNGCAFDSPVFFIGSLCTRLLNCPKVMILIILLGFSRSISKNRHLGQQCQPPESWDLCTSLREAGGKLRTMIASHVEEQFEVLMLEGWVVDDHVLIDRALRRRAEMEH